MTRKEQIKEAAQNELRKYPNLFITVPAFEMGAEWADAHPHWIRVEDELPKGFAIITNGDDVLIGKYNFEKGLWGVRNKTMFAYTLLPANWNVTHWMHLPQPPKKGGEDE